MKGYCYLDVDGKLNFKSDKYIEEDDPLFWSNNQFFIVQVWRFNTEDISSLYKMYSRFKTLKLKSNEVVDFSKGIGFDHRDLLIKLKEYNQGEDSI